MILLIAVLAIIAAVSLVVGYRMSLRNEHDYAKIARRLEQDREKFIAKGGRCNFSKQSEPPKK